MIALRAPRGPRSAPRPMPQYDLKVNLNSLHPNEHRSTLAPRQTREETHRRHRCCGVGVDGEAPALEVLSGCASAGALPVC